MGTFFPQPTRRLLFWSAAGAAGAASSWLLAQAVLFLLPQAPPAPMGNCRPIPVTLAPPPPPEERPRKELPPRKVSPLPASTRSPSRKARASSGSLPPLPALPELEWAQGGPGATPLPLPALPTLPPGRTGPPGGGGSAGEGGGPREASFHRTPFHWIYAPELNDREAMERAWPRRALLRGLGGRVTLEVTVGKDLKVHSARVVSARPKGVFEDAAIRMVLRWRGSRPGVFLQPVRFVPPEPGTW